jgi:hypothetical protein
LNKIILQPQKKRISGKGEKKLDDGEKNSGIGEKTVWKG